MEFAAWKVAGAVLCFEGHMKYTDISGAVAKTNLSGHGKNAKRPSGQIHTRMEEHPNVFFKFDASSSEERGFYGLKQNFDITSDPEMLEILLKHILPARLREYSQCVIKACSTVPLREEYTSYSQQALIAMARREREGPVNRMKFLNERFLKLSDTLNSHLLPS